MPPIVADLPKGSSRRLDQVTLIVFLLLLLAPTADLALRPGARRSAVVEMRNPANLPPLPRTLQAWSALPSRLGAWYGDHFGLRDVLLAGNSALKVFVFGTSPSPALVIGKNRWLFPTEQRCLDVWRGVAPLSEPELEAWRRSLESRRNWLAARKIPFLFVLAPSKPEIYPEFLPGRLHKTGPNRVEQLARYLEEHSDVRTLDLRAALLQEKERDAPGDTTYFPLGTHWNQRGALAGTRAIVAALAPLFPAIATVPDEPVSFVAVDDPGDTWAPRMYLSGTLVQITRAAKFADETRRSVRSHEAQGGNRSAFDQDDASLPRALVFNDSFGQALAASLPRHFSHIVFVQTSEFDVQEILAEHPEVVIEVYSDRALVIQHPLELDAERTERLSRAFDGSDEVLVRYDPAANRPPITVHEWTRLETRSDEQGPALACIVTNARGTVLLPEFRARPEIVPVLRLEMESPVATGLDLLYQTRAIPSYQRDQRLHVPVAPGRNHIYLEIVDPDVIGRLLLRPGSELGTYLIRSLEVRAVRR